MHKFLVAKPVGIAAEHVYEHACASTVFEITDAEVYNCMGDLCISVTTDYRMPGAEVGSRGHA